MKKPDKPYSYICMLETRMDRLSLNGHSNNTFTIKIQKELAGKPMRSIFASAF